MISDILYIHGFNSSPQSYKAQAFSRWLAVSAPHIALQVPALSPYPLEAIAQLQALIDEHAPAGLIGSSLGGFYATYLAERYNTRACLINPSVYPFETLAHYLGSNQNLYTHERYQFEQQHVEQLRSLYLPELQRPRNLLLLQQTGDETLDYREACARYRQSPAIIEAGGDHAFQGIDRYFPAMLRFLEG